MDNQYYDIERRTAIKEEARLFRRKFDDLNKVSENE